MTESPHPLLLIIHVTKNIFLFNDGLGLSTIQAPQGGQFYYFFFMSKPMCAVGIFCVSGVAQKRAC